ncbi:MAG TPA: FHA domain-containing protein [Luteolibacter sp.]|nr:FHA domain-containing protein [Luteolibacter sp.]
MPRVTITVPESNSQPYRFQLDREVVRLGRGGDNDIVIDSGSVSTNHAEMRRVYGGYELHDIGSTNGLKLDGIRQLVVPLYHGATVQMGDVAFDFSLTDEEQDMLAAEGPSAQPVIPLPDVPVSTQPLGQAVQPRPVPKRQVIRVEQESGGGFMMTFLLIIFALLAFAAGVMVRHEKETGGSLIDHIQAKREGKVAAPPAAGDDAETPALPTPVAPPPPAPIAPPAPAIPAPTLPPAGDSAPPAPGQ